MRQRSDDYKDSRTRRNIIFIGEIGTGKSSVINLLIGSGTHASVSNDSQPCTQASTRYETTLNDTQYFLWDTRGLSEARSWYQYFLGGGSEKELKTFLKERHRSHEIDLLVYCVRGVRATTAFIKYYNDICAITRLLAAPVAIVATQLEKEANMEDWWTRNHSSMRELGMVFDDHACITALPGHPRGAESKEKLASLITRDHRWEAKETGSYFGSPVQKPTSAPSAAPLQGGMGQRVFRPRGKTSIDDEGLSRSSSNQSSTPSTAPSQASTSYHTADSPTASTLSSPVEPPTPRAATAPVKVPHNIDTNLPGSNHQPQPSSDETPSTKSSLYSMFHPSPHSSCTSHSEVNMEPPTEEREDYYFSELPFKQSNATVRRRSPYATRNGAFGDIWECDLVSGDSSRIVAVKAMRTNTSGSDDSRCHDKKLRRELRVWGKLRHRNIVPLLGVVSGFGRLPSPVSPWFHKGSLSHHMAHHQLSMSDKHSLLGDIVVGLCYLHSQNIVHGDLHSANVLIDDDGTACLTDFGLSFIRDSMGTSYLKAGGICGVIHFADPAVVKIAYNSESQPQDEFCPTKPGDIYSFGGIMLHVLSGKRPYDGISSPMIILMIMNGKRSQIPIHDHITQSHKSLIEICWHPEERKRPSADNLVRKFGRT